MNWLARGLVFLATLGMLSGCGSQGSAANPPSNLTARAGDGRVTLTWTMTPNVQYWVYYGPASSISVDNWTTIPGSLSLQNVTSPLTVTTLTNGTTYAFTMDGRTNNGPGGSGTPSVAAVPRLSGTTWTTGSPIGTADLNSVGFGTVGGNPLFVTVGAGGKIASSPDGVAWTSVANPPSAANLNAVAFGGSSFVAAGAGGVILNSSDGAIWTADTSPTGSAIYGLTSNGANFFVGVGASGTIIYSGNGVTWTTANSGTTSDLLAVGYGNGEFVAVGNAGKLLVSADGVTWTAEPSNTSLNLRSVAYGTNATTATGLFVAVGASGALVTSPDGITWTSAAPLPVANINRVVYGTQFVLVGDSGAIYTSTTGSSWTVQSSGTTSMLKGLATSLYSYSAVGASGTNLSSM